jgi:hypothetical protein
MSCRQNTRFLQDDDDDEDDDDDDDDDNDGGDMWQEPVDKYRQ